ncbi:MAG: hypothetical protein ACYTEV_03070 [Planctomycetota bacterium]|jgi:hypothetical protein
MSRNETVRLAPCCIDLRHKLMECDSRHMVRGMVDDSSETRVFFCACTQDQFGPDRGPVDPESCHSGRGCWRAAPIGIAARGGGGGGGDAAGGSRA